MEKTEILREVIRVCVANRARRDHWHRLSDAWFNDFRRLGREVCVFLAFLENVSEKRILRGFPGISLEEIGKAITEEVL